MFVLRNTKELVIAASLFCILLGQQAYAENAREQLESNIRNECYLRAVQEGVVGHPEL